ncbi:MAG TPA: hypothetical protein VKA53_04815 [Thermoanaerobaculia bacterium]|nr:hypothetical protein [Thermoanaerobaculia bacterium]
MRARLVSLLWMSLALPSLAGAGTPRVNAIPTLGEYGIVVVAVGLVATGIAVLRDRKH